MKDLVNGFDNTSTCPYDSGDNILKTPTPFSIPYYRYMCLPLRETNNNFQRLILFISLLITL